MVLREAFCAIVATILLLLVSMYIDAPLESIADPSTSTNPSKAPWYFLGLQELLVYFSPWVAGVLIPICIVLGLAAIPYIDIKGGDQKNSTSYPLENNMLAVFTGGMILWIVLTVMGVYLRGPNWRLQWPDGTPLGANIAVEPSGWLIPAILTGYFLLVLLRKKNILKSINRLGIPRIFIAHVMILSGLIVTIKIIFYTLLSF